MKKLISILVMGMLYALLSPSATAQQATLQIIHNSADPAAAVVDIYVNGNLYKDDVAFRAATAFDSVPSNTNLLVGIAPGTSNDMNGGGYDDTLATFGPYNLMPSTNYVILAQGVLNPGDFDLGTNTPADAAFELAVLAPANTGSGSMMNIDVAVSHGSPDAPAVDIFANGGEDALLNDVPYGANTGGYLTVPAAEYIFTVAASADSTNAVASFYLDGSGLGGGAAVVFASGFLAPGNQPMGAEAFGLFAALPDGMVAPLTPIGGSKAQVIHNSADPAAAVVDIYVDIITDTVKLDNVAFRKATGFLDLPSGYPLKITFAGENSSDITDGAITTISTPALENGTNYHVVANGVVNPGDFVANPDMEDIAFGLLYNVAQTTGSGNDVDVAVLHGSTDAPTVDILVNGGTPPFVDGATYKDFAPYQSVPAADYDLNITLDGDNDNLLYTFGADLNGLDGRALIVVASGFLTNITDPNANQMGEPFGLIAFLDDGTDVVLPLRTNTAVDEDIENKGGVYGVYPVPARDWTYLAFRLVRSEEVTVQLYDQSGRVVVNQQLGEMGFGDHEVALPIQNLSSGLYQVVFSTPTLRSVRKLVVTK